MVCLDKYGLCHVQCGIYKSSLKVGIKVRNHGLRLMMKFYLEMYF
jgi:hypothetical protein